MAALNIVGVDPHRRTFTATVLDARGGELGHAHFPNTRTGHGAGLAWAGGLGPVERWGVEGASGLGRHLAEFLVAAGCDVRDVPPHKTSVRGRGRHEGKTDRLDSQRVAAETQTNPVSLVRSSRLHRRHPIRSAIGSRCGTTPAPPSPKSASSSSASSTRWCTICARTCAPSSGRRRRSAPG
jgi:transposase